MTDETSEKTEQRPGKCAHCVLYVLLVTPLCTVRRILADWHSSTLKLFISPNHMLSVPFVNVFPAYSSLNPRPYRCLILSDTPAISPSVKSNQQTDCPWDSCLFYNLVICKLWEVRYLSSHRISLLRPGAITQHSHHPSPALFPNGPRPYFHSLSSISRDRSHVLVLAQRLLLVCFLSNSLHSVYSFHFTFSSQPQTKLLRCFYHVYLSFRTHSMSYF